MTCYNQKQGVGMELHQGFLGRGPSPQAELPWRGEDQASPDASQGQPCPPPLGQAGFFQVLTSPRRWSLAVPTSYPHLAPLTPGAQSRPGWETDARTHFPSEPWRCVMSVMTVC